MFCTSCGAAVESDWAFCPECARPVHRQAASSKDEARAADWGAAPTGDESVAQEPVSEERVSREPISEEPADVESARDDQAEGRPLIAVALLIVASGLTVASLFPPYFLHGPALIHNAQSGAFGFIGVGGWVVAALLLLRARTATTGAGLAIGVSLAWVPVFLTAIGAVVTNHAAAEVGYWLGLAGAVTALAASYACAVYLRTRGMLRLRRDSTGHRRAAIGLVVGVGYLATTFGNWTLTTTHLTLNGAKISKHGACCTLAHARGWSLASQVLVLTAAVLIPAVAGLVASRAASAGLLLGVAIGVGANPAAVMARLRQTIDPQSFGITKAAITQYDINVSQRGLAALYIALGVVVVMLLLGSVRLRVRQRDVSPPVAEDQPAAVLSDPVSSTA